MNRIHGLVIRAGVALPGLPHADAEVADVELEIVDRLTAALTGPSRYCSGTPADPTSRVEIGHTLSGSLFFRYGDGTAFDVEYRERSATIRAMIAPGQTLEDMTAYLYGPVLGFILRAWGRLALHASCVRIENSAVLLAGDSGAGKSTTAAALAARGVPVLSDDLTALTEGNAGQMMAWPSFDHLRLWSSSEAIVLGESGRLDRITPGWDKRRFPLIGENLVVEPCQLSAVIILEPRTKLRRTSMRLVAPASALIALTTLTYANYLLDTTMRATELAQLGALVRAVPVYSVAPSSDPAGIDDLCDAIRRVPARHAHTVG